MESCKYWHGLHAVIAEVGMLRTLEEVGVGHANFPVSAKNSLDDIWVKANTVLIWGVAGSEKTIQCPPRMQSGLA